ncbi:SDR family oxidoreductase [Dyella sp.]|uniref:SDR family oxidoreductase n=1 Tax=Dyella sp. TaxID=1869338 RepID=UPI002ED28027
MSILITGSTGTVGTQVLNRLAGSGSEIRALTRSPGKASFPSGVTAVGGDLADLDAFKAALAGVSTLFLVVPNVADEVTQAMQALTLAHEAGVKGMVYVSVFKSEAYADVPHFAGKYTAERMIEALDLPVTVLRPAYFIQNDLRQKAALLEAGIYGMPIGDKGLSMVDVRDIGEAAASELLRRERSPTPLPRETYELVGPQALHGHDMARIWSDTLGRSIRYGGHDVVTFEQRMKAFMPAWYVLDMRLMLNRYQAEGAVATSRDVERLTHLLGHAPRSYADFAREAAAQWLDA